MTETGVSQRVCIDDDDCLLKLLFNFKINHLKNKSEIFNLKKNENLFKKYK